MRPQITEPTDLLLEMREQARKLGDYGTSDLIRDELDRRLVFVFDTKDGPEVYYLFDGYFRANYSNGQELQTKRAFLEARIAWERKADKAFDAWLKTMGEVVASKERFARKEEAKIKEKERKQNGE